MLRHLHHRHVHHILLTALCLTLYLPNLGVPSLWDIDEGNNLEAAREMFAADNWHVPTFNFALRVDKPAFLYWLQIFGYLQFGVGEFAGRLPSALAALLTVLTTYELGRKMFSAGAGLCAGIALATAIMFGAAAHFANPDALLAACTTLTFFCFWAGLKHSGRIWFVPVNVAMAGAVLAKGPVGVVLPVTVVVLYVVVTRQWRLLLDRRMLIGAFVFLLVALPWYLWVGVDTKFAFLRGFIGTHNVDRFLGSMEGHSGPVYYYLVVLALGLVPASVFLLPMGWQLWKSWRDARTAGEPDQTLDAKVFLVCWILVYGVFFTISRTKLPNYYYLVVLALGLVPASVFLMPMGWQLWKSWRDARPADERDETLDAKVFLLCWILVYVVFFTISRTKLPNYVLPAYPAVALLIGQFLNEWRLGRATPPAWMMRASFVCLGLIGVATAAGFLIASGVMPTLLTRGRCFPELRSWAWLGVLPLIAAILAAWWTRRQQRTAAMTGIAVVAVLFLAPLGAWGARVFDHYKSTRPLAQSIHEHQVEREIRVAAYEYFQPSMVYYCRREVQPVASDSATCEFLRSPIQVFVIMPAPTWERLCGLVRVPCRVVGKHWDMYRNCEVIVVTNR
jgi:4-amino-4-deoxy-L-arabinose transferase-like glycosyltransferase